VTYPAYLRRASGPVSVRWGPFGILLGLLTMGSRIEAAEPDSLDPTPWGGFLVWGHFADVSGTPRRNLSSLW